MRWLYSLAWWLALPLLWPWWAWRSRASGDAHTRGRWVQRLGFGAVPEAARGGLLVHAASVGESVAATALLRAWRARVPGAPVLLTCTSLTGARRLRSEWGEDLHQRFLPFDLPGAMARLLDAAQPRLIVLMETELWPNLIHAAQVRGIPLVLANARLSARSTRGYTRVATLMRPVWQQGLWALWAQSEAVASRFVALGVPPERIAVHGNLKVDVQASPELRALAQGLKAQLGGRPVLVAASVHPGEWPLLLDAFASLRERHPSLLLLLVPRHPERFEAAAQALAQRGLSFVRRSRGEHPEAGTAVWLGDTMGEMMLWLALADLAFIGGSLIPHGGHSPLEAMAWGKPVLSGRAVRNFAEAYAALDAAQGLGWVDDAASLVSEVDQLLSDGGLRAQRGQAAAAVAAAAQGAVARSAAALHGLWQRHGLKASEAEQEVVWHSLGVGLPPQPFEAGAWQARGELLSRGGGRASAAFVRSAGTSSEGWVLRHYRRGGALARWLGDRFWGQRVLQSRAMQEFGLLQRLCGLGLPVPEPVAARMQRVGRLWHRADILVRRIPDSQTLVQRLASEAGMAPAQWQALGQALRRMHEAGVWHADLNAHNLLLDVAGRAYVIDFDRCALRPGQAGAASARWKAANLRRLLRSLRKEARLQPGLAWNEARDWPLLLSAYAQWPVPGPPTAHSIPPSA
jgi:3-deoxy-D-manno-octulosonic-acid transferase